MTDVGHRIIARLDVKGPNLVKGIHLEGLRVLGNPSEYAKFYYENGVDEIFYMDVVASLYDRNSLHEIISETAKDVFIPITVGGGLRSLEDIKKVLRSGADEVCLNTAAVKNPSLIKEASRAFGSSTIVVAIEAIKQRNGEYLAFIDNGREHTGKEVSKWAKEVESLGAGEIVITSVDSEGTGLGFDHELIKLVSKSVNIPVVAHGGAKNELDIAKAIKNSEASAVAIASILHYGVIENKFLTSKSNIVEGNDTFLKSGSLFKKIKGTSIKAIKNHLLGESISCRPYNEVNYEA